MAKTDGQSLTSRNIACTVLGGLAEFGRELIRSRTGKGRKRAMALRFARPPKLTHHPGSALLRVRHSPDVATTYNQTTIRIGLRS
jgi:hypothetical protein